MDILFVMEMIGTVAFAWSGAMIAIRKQLDLLGILILGVTTAVGGGMIRDLIIGVHPPTLFVKPVYVTVAAVSVLILFLVIKSRHFLMETFEGEFYRFVFNLMDAIGLGAFTVVGLNTAFDNNIFLRVFLGVLTGVGGGLLRDMMAVETPAILRKHIYACASLIGALFYILAIDVLYMDEGVTMFLTTILITVVRVLARHYKWNLPRAY